MGNKPSYPELVLPATVVFTSDGAWFVSIRCKRSVRWQHISWMKDVVFRIVKRIFSREKHDRLSSGTSNAIVATTDGDPFVFTIL